MNDENIVVIEFKPEDLQGHALGIRAEVRHEVEAIGFHPEQGAIAFATT